jgi:hypothetical protein
MSSSYLVLLYFRNYPLHRVWSSVRHSNVRSSGRSGLGALLPSKETAVLRSRSLRIANGFCTPLAISKKSDDTRKII